MVNGRLRVLFLAVADLTCVYVSWLVSVWGYGALGFGYYPNGMGFYLKFWPVGFAFLGLNVMMRLYHRSVFYPAAPLNPVEEFRRLIASAAILHFSTLAVLALAYQSTVDHSRAAILLAGLLTGLLVQPFRDLLRLLLKRLDLLQIPVELLGEGQVAKAVERTIATDPYLGFKVVPHEASIAVVCKDIRLFKVELPELLNRYTHIEYVAGSSVYPILGAQAVDFDGAGALEMVNQRHMTALRVEKWVLDRILAVLALVLLSPFFIVVPILIKLTSKGPVFYRQDRLGLRGRGIRVWKFRSMFADADARLAKLLADDPERHREWDEHFKLADDPRVTWVGRILRKTSIDEFPQLFNVFAGDMALVGPRPIVAAEVPKYGAAYEVFSSVKPGITGLWQATGRSSTDYARRVALDFYYILNWSPWMDIWILFRTVFAVLFMRGAC